jgi:hypothetical protein
MHQAPLQRAGTRLTVSIRRHLNLFRTVAIIIHVESANDSIAAGFPFRDCVGFREFCTSEHIATRPQDRFVDSWQWTGPHLPRHWRGGERFAAL